MFQDLRFGMRMLRRQPGFTLFAMIALALGIGANTAIFSVVDAILLRPLPFSDPDRLMMVWQTWPQGEYPQLYLAYPNLADLREQTRTLESVGAWNSQPNTRFNLTGGTSPEQAQYAVVSSNLFSVLGVKPIIGRTFLPEEERMGAPPVVIISYGLWQRRFGADPKLVGQPLTLDGHNYTVVGIMPAGFIFPRYPKDSEMWIPLGNDPYGGRRYSPGTRYLSTVARLKEGVTPAQAQAEMNMIAKSIEQQRPQFNLGRGMQLTPLHRQITNNLRLALLVLLGAVGFVLLIACANVANLLLARSSARQKEMAMRSALGATRLRLVRQLLIESILLAALGGALGLLLAKLGTKLFAVIPYNGASYLIPYYLPHEQIGLNLKVLGFTLALTLVTGMIFGLAPALQISRQDIQPVLNSGGISSGFSPQTRFTRGTLIVAEIALSLMLLIGAGLMIKSFWRLQAVNPGFDPEHVLTAEISLPRFKYDNGSKIDAFYQQLFTQLLALPGVQSVGAISSLPLSGTDAETAFFIDGKPTPDPKDRPRTHPRTISSDYFRTMGIPIIRGRAFTGDNHSAAARVAIISETMARRYWPGHEAIGQRIALDFEAMKYFPDRPPQLDLASGIREIVGIVRDVKYMGLDTESQPEMYVPAGQRPEREMSIIIRTTADPAGLAASLRNEVQTIDPDLPVANVRSMPQLLSNSIAKPRFNYLLLSVFAAVALILATTGVYGVMAYAATQRTREFGIRLALGAQRREILKLIFKQGGKLVMIGISLGLAGALALTHFMKSLLFGVSTTDPLTIASVAGLLIAIAFLACYFPARKASKVDPITALRHQ